MLGVRRRCANLAFARVGSRTVALMWSSILNTTWPAASGTYQTGLISVSFDVARSSEARPFAELHGAMYPTTAGGRDASPVGARRMASRATKAAASRLATATRAVLGRPSARRRPRVRASAPVVSTIDDA